MEKNVAGKWTVFAYGSPTHATLAGKPITGDAVNITANVRIDGGAANAVDDTNPSELEDGYYVFDATAAEVNGDLISIHPQSSTANVIVIGVPGAVWTRPANFNDLSVEASTGRMDVAKVAGTAQTANDNGGDINAVKAVTDLLPNAGALNDLATLVGRLTAPRAGYLDKLNITGNVAASSEVTAIQNNTRVRVIVPPMIERPDSGSTLYKLHLYIYDDAGNMEAPDSAPTLTVVNESGTSRAANLGTVTLESAGHYSVTYTVADSHAIEQLIFEWTVIEGAVTRYHGSASQIVDTTAVDFTTADRTKLDTLHDTRLTAARAGYMDELAAANLPTDIDTLIARLTATRATNLDELGSANIPADVDTLMARLTATRATYLDKLNISGNVAASSEVTAIQNNTRVRVIVPPMIERPDSGSTLYKLHLYIYDAAGNMEAPDSAPTLTVVNESGTSRAANLGTVTLESAGHYSVTYTVADSHAIEQLIFEWTVIEGAVTRYHGSASQIVDTTAVDFTTADRTKLDTLHDTRLTAARAGYIDELAAANLPTDVAANAAAIAALNDFDPTATPVEILASGGGAGGKTAAELVVDFWSDLLTTYTDGMAGKRVKGITAVPVEEGTINDVGATTTTFITTLTGFEDNHFQDALCIVEIATDQWQGRPILSSNGTTGQIVLDEGLTSAPANGVNVVVQAQHIHPVSQIADGWLDRDMSLGTDSGSSTVRTPRQALRANRNKVGVAGGTMTVYKEDDTTASHTAAVTTAAGDPISEIDPAG